MPIDSKNRQARTLADVVAGLPSPNVAELPAPAYTGQSPVPVALAVESMKRHGTDEGWQIMAGLDQAGYILAGHGLSFNSVEVPQIIQKLDPGVLFLQDKREWEGKTAGPGFDDRERFRHVSFLKNRTDVFKLTILKDAHQKTDYHRESADEIDCHAWVVYYHPTVINHLAPYVRSRHLIRTYHTVDSALVPASNVENRRGCLLSGAMGRGVYPLRTRLMEAIAQLPETTLLRHPGYGRAGCVTPDYLRALSTFKVSICTSSVYGYALRKIIESTACGCIVITDLPVEDRLPEIDANLVRVRSDFSVKDTARLIRHCLDTYNVERQEFYADRAKEWYDYRASGRRLAADIENARTRYKCGSS